MQLKLNLKETMFFILAILFFGSCTKVRVDSPIQSHSIVDVFFNIPTNTNKNVIKVVNDLKLQNSKYNFVTNLIKKGGYPIWDKCLIHEKENLNLSKGVNNLTGETEAGFFIYIPLVLENADDVNAYIFADYTNTEDIKYSFHNRSEYNAKNFSPISSPDQKNNANILALKLMILENNIKEIPYFDIKDKRLFKENIPDYLDTLKKVVDIKNVDQVGARIRFESVILTVTTYTYRPPDGGIDNVSGNNWGIWGYYIVETTTYNQTNVYYDDDALPIDVAGGFIENINNSDPLSSNQSPDESWENLTGFPVITTDPVITLTSPCFVNSFSKVTAEKLKNDLIKLYRQTFVGLGLTHKLLVEEGSAVFDPNGNPLASQSTRDFDDPTLWVIDLNTNYASNFTQEVWGSIIYHEMVHGFIEMNNLGFNPFSAASLDADHLKMLDKWITQIRYALQESFNIPSQDALALSLEGFDGILKDDNHNFKQEMIDHIQSKYNVNLVVAHDLANQYYNGVKGVKCD